MIENAGGGLFVSTDGGESWTLTSSDNNIRQRAWYYNKVFVDPKNENLVYCPNVEFMRSRDGGNRILFEVFDASIQPEARRREVRPVGDPGQPEPDLNHLHRPRAVLEER